MSDVRMVRERECRAAEEFITRAGVGPAGLLIDGEPGIGKTTVWLDAVRRAGLAGFAVMSTRGAAAEARLSHAGLADLLADVDAAIFGCLAPVQLAALDRVLLRGNGGPQTDERAIAAAFLKVVERLAEDSPVLIAIDDEQWLDPSSRLVVRYAVRRLRGRVGVLVTARIPEAGVVDTGTSLDLPQSDGQTRIRMYPLKLGGLHVVLAKKLGHALPRPVIARIHAISGGNPFYGLELARVFGAESSSGVERLPESLAELVRRRFDAIHADAADLVLLTACASQPTVDLIARASGRSPDAVTDSLESAEEAGIIRFDGPRLNFTHPLLGHGAYSNASWARRRSAHARLAGVIEQPELRARHLALAMSSEPATLKALDAAADNAAERGASSEAAELLDMAIDLGGDTTERRLRAAESHFRAGSLTRARRQLDFVFANAPKGALRWIALMLLAAIEGYGENLPAAVDALATVTDEATDPGLRLRALVHLAPATGLLGDMRRCVELARDAVALAKSVEAPALLSQALAIWVDVSFIYGLGFDDAALRLALADEQPDSGGAAFQATAVAAAIAGRTGDLERGRRDMAVVQQRFVDRGSETDIMWAASHAVLFDVWLGRYRDASHAAQEALQRADQMGGRHPRVMALTGVAAVAAYTGNADDARTAAHEAIATAHLLGAAFMTIAPSASLAFVEASLGRYAEALAAIEPLLTAFDPEHDTEIWVGAWLPDAIEALCALGRVDEADPLVDALLVNGSRLDRPWIQAVGWRGRALCLAARGDVAGAQSAAEAALLEHERLPMPFEKARTQLLLGQLMRRRRQRLAAVATVTEALTTFDSLGSPVWSARALDEMQRLNGAVASDFGLTPAEQRVALRAAAGLSNKQIASELFLSVKTVETNLSCVYRKLGIRSRAQLFARMGRRVE